MKTIRIEGLEGQGPGDIVGAITHQAEISGELIGDIEIDGDTAVVEIDANVAELVVEKMRDNKVGSTEVEVTLLDDDERPGDGG